MAGDALRGEPVLPAQTRLVLGQVVAEAGVPQVTVGGVVLAARWLDPVSVSDGDPVLVALVAGPTGQSEAVVLGRTASRPRPAEGTVTANPAGAMVTVSTVEGSLDVVEGYASPTVGDVVRLVWAAGVGTAVAKVTAVEAPPAPSAPSAPPGPASSGSESVAAVDTGSYNLTGGFWSTTLHPMQGTWDGRTYSGAWFYGTRAAVLDDGRVIHRVRMWLPARRRQGSWNAAGAINLYAHTSPARPGGDVFIVTGPHSITLPAGWAGGWVDLPSGWASTLLAGGGIGCYGSPYLGVSGLAEDPQSGALVFDWTR